jgi:Uma2 family endonuclease
MPSSLRQPGDRPRNIQRKIELYLAHGSRLVLDVDPKTRTVAAHDASSVRTLKEGDPFEHPAAPGLTFDLRSLFASVA